ncbi:hypothetical protein [Bosea sp. 685]|uniref:hypothetical protein n=1 Tax=Bosea sp. 685 TaxID=3080057 RepID=UPI002892E577|nr:hypothetical protein [Bosea sp. 685]WNJ89128.1 hypothetical protein RMR04_22310 [Bosea sp. 685]
MRSAKIPIDRPRGQLSRQMTLQFHFNGSIIASDILGFSAFEAARSGDIIRITHQTRAGPMSTESLEGTVLRLAHHYSDPEDLLKAVRKAHPDASKKDIIHAVFATMIDAAGSNDGIARRLHGLAMNHRGDE